MYTKEGHTSGKFVIFQLLGREHKCGCLVDEVVMVDGYLNSVVRSVWWSYDGLVKKRVKRVDKDCLLEKVILVVGIKKF